MTLTEREPAPPQGPKAPIKNEISLEVNGEVLHGFQIVQAFWIKAKKEGVFEKLVSKQKDARRKITNSKWRETQSRDLQLCGEYMEYPRLDFEQIGQRHRLTGERTKRIIKGYTYFTKKRRRHVNGTIERVWFRSSKELKREFPLRILRSIKKEKPLRNPFEKRNHPIPQSGLLFIAQIGRDLKDPTKTQQEKEQALDKLPKEQVIRLRRKRFLKL